MLTLAAFALNYGEFWLLAQIYSQNQLAKAMAILKQLPGILEHSIALKPRFDALRDLVTAILDVTWCVIDLKELPSAYISREVPAMSTAVAHIPTAVYWTIRSIVACATQITSLTSMGYEYVLLLSFPVSYLQILFFFIATYYHEHYAFLVSGLLYQPVPSHGNYLLLLTSLKTYVIISKSS